MGISPHILILAAGKGKRMVSSLPKVLHPVLFRPMVHHVIDVARSLPHQSIQMVVGHGEDAVREACAPFPGLNYVVQKEQRGTGHAVRMAEPVLKEKPGHVLILSGDVILLRRASLETLLRQHETSGSACTLTSAKVAVPRGYGRILRGPSGEVRAIREEADCNAPEKEISEVNAGIYVFEIGALFAALAEISDSNRQNEFYLTDAIAGLVSAGKKVSAVVLDDPLEMTGINDRKALAEVENILRSRVNDELMMKGVTLHQPATIVIDPRCRIEADATIEGGCTLIDSSVAKGAVIESGCRIVGSEIGPGVRLKQGSYVESSQIGEKSAVGR
jgi:bifunctional UDP-N-acetylglucosamine pyrophosphorylase/glucosamine-1-phosphate N-acetyltransferase